MPDDSLTVASEMGQTTAAPASWDELPPEWGDYDQVTPIAQGGMGMVYRARHRQLNRLEAIKVIRSGAAARSLELQRFRLEAEAAGALNHPHIVPVYGVGEMLGIPYFAMKWVIGGDLSERKAAYKNDPKAIAKLMAKVARAMQHAHGHGILHRDLKPGNILIDLEGEPHVTDFGLAKRFGEIEIHAKENLTVTGAVVGTPKYMSPEQARGEKAITTATDIYALGAILYELLTGQPPITGGSLADILRRIVTEPPAKPSVREPSADPDLEAVCLKCLEKNPKDRYRTAADLADELERVAKGEHISIRPPALSEWLVREFTKTPAPFPGYVWEVKIWFGVIIAAVQATIFSLALFDGPAWGVWVASVVGWVAAGYALWHYMADRFTRLPETEQHSVMIAIGLIVSHAAITVASIPFLGPAKGALAAYPALTAAAAFALFTIGTTHWGRFYWYGLIVMICVPITAIFPMAAPLILGVSVSAVMWNWAWYVKVKFNNQPGESELGEPGASATGGTSSR